MSIDPHEYDGREVEELLALADGNSITVVLTIYAESQTVEYIVKRRRNANEHTRHEEAKSYAALSEAVAAYNEIGG